MSSLRRYCLLLILACVLCALGSVVCRAQDVAVTPYQGRRVEAVEVALEGVTQRFEGIERSLREFVTVAPDTEYSVAQGRASLLALFESGRISDARIEIVETNPGIAASPLRVRFIVRPQPRVSEVIIALEAAPGTNVTEDELRARLTLLEPGARVTETNLRRNADQIQTYLRERGFYRANVEFSQTPAVNGIRTAITFGVQPGAQATVESFAINIPGFDTTDVRKRLRLQPGEEFSVARLTEDVTRVRDAIIRKDFLAPILSEPQFTLDAERNTIAINLTGSVGPKVEVEVKGFDIGRGRQRELFPVLREGSIEPGAIVEGERRLENSLQEDGYFFAEVTPACAITPPLPDAVDLPTGTPGTCELLNPEELLNRQVNITYTVEAGRRLRLRDIRIEGTEKISVEDPELSARLRTREATVLGIVPFLGYGRGYTSRENLAQDENTIEARMRELGYRRASVDVRQGVSLDGENLIITFVVNEGPLTRVSDVALRGNKIYTPEQLRAELDETVTDAPFSAQQARRDAERLLSFYRRNGYFDSNVRFDTIELPSRETVAGGTDERVRVLYTITEGDKVYINRIFINGNARTERDAILKALTLREGDLLRLDRITETERALFGTDAFRNVTVRTEAAAENANGFKTRNVIIEVEEIKPRTIAPVIGFSTDTGPLGGFEFRNTNFRGKLQQASVRVRASQRQQLVRLEFFDPRFRAYDSDRQFAPLVLSAQYSRDTSVTRFFRSTLDRGQAGVVQFLDSEGNPIDPSVRDEFGNPRRTGAPTINRFTFSAETRRDFERVTNDRGEFSRLSSLVLRYTYEDVRLYNTESLLIRRILEPDRTVRLSRFGVSFARDTRDNQRDATRGQFITLDYSLALRQLGGNISFSRLQTSYRRYDRFGSFRDRPIVFATGVGLGLANLFQVRDRNRNGVIDASDRRLPISERFFSGGSTTLRGFDFEEAGPHVAVQGGQLLNQQGESVTVDPFTVPVGGNALAIVNLEARVPVSKSIQLVPFYDGGNVFERVGDIFGGRERTPDPNDNLALFPQNLDARWTNTVGLGLRLRTPFGPVAVDYAYLLRPQRFQVPQSSGIPAFDVLPRSQIHIRFGQAF